MIGEGKGWKSEKEKGRAIREEEWIKMKGREMEKGKEGREEGRNKMR